MCNCHCNSSLMVRNSFIPNYGRMNFMSNMPFMQSNMFGGGNFMMPNMPFMQPNMFGGGNFMMPNMPFMQPNMFGGGNFMMPNMPQVNNINNNPYLSPNMINQLLTNISNQYANIGTNLGNQYGVANKKSAPAEVIQGNKGNIGQNLENWVTSNNKNSGFLFLDQNLKEVPKDKKAETYRNGVTKLAQARIGANDSDKNGKMNLAEYISEQKRMYKKMYGEDMSLTQSGVKEMLNAHFDVIDMDANGQIDEKEMATALAYMDAYDSRNNTMDGQISYSALGGTDWFGTDTQAQLKKYKKHIFGEEK